MTSNRTTTRTFDKESEAIHFLKELSRDPGRYSVGDLRKREYKTALGEILVYWEITYRDWKSLRGAV